MATAATPQSLRQASLTYGIGFLVSRAASVLMLPVYTRYLTVADYGALHLIELTLEVSVLLLRAGVTNGVMRFYFKTDDETARNRIVVSSYYLVQAFDALAAIALFFSSAWIAQSVLDGAHQAPLVRIAAANLLLEGCVLVPMLFLQTRQQARAYTLVSVTRLTLQVSLNVLFLVGLRWGVQGPLVGTLISNALIGLPLVAWMLGVTGLKAKKDAVVELLRFGLPYRLAQAGTFILTFGDRFFIRLYRDVGEIGVYSLAYQFGFLLVFLTAVPYMQAWNPRRFQWVDQPRVLRDQHYSAGLRYLSIVMIAAGVGIVLFVDPVLTIVSAPDFRRAAALVPILVLAYVFQALADVVEFGIQVSERTRYVTGGTWLSVVVIVGLYLLLIPPLGGLGAAIATLVAFAVRFWCFKVFAHRLWPIDYNWSPTIRLICFGVIASLPSVAWVPANVVNRFACAVGLYCLFLGSVWFGGVLPPEERVVVKQAVRDRFLKTTRLRW